MVPMTKRKRPQRHTREECVYEAADGKDAKVQQKVDEDGEKDRVSNINDERKLSHPTTRTS